MNFEFFPITEKTVRGRTKRYRATPVTRTICAVGMLALVCMVGVIMQYSMNTRRRLSDDEDITSKSECNNFLEQIPVLAVIVYAFCLIVLFIGLANITDEYFVPALTVMGKRLKLSEDVTGATLMASGSSAPELFTSAVDAFLHESSIGIGTIVGSAVFNILVIIACSGAWATKSLVIDWKPFTRDCTFYSISIILLVIMIQWDGDKVGRIWWWEGLVMFLSYGFYVLIMAYNKKLMACMARCAGEELDEENQENTIHKMKALGERVECVIVLFNPNADCNKSLFSHFEPVVRKIEGVSDVRYDSEQRMFCVEFVKSMCVYQKHLDEILTLTYKAIATGENKIHSEIVSPSESKNCTCDKYGVECKIVRVKCNPENAKDCEKCEGVESDVENDTCFLLRWIESAANFYTDGWMVIFTWIPDVNTEDLEDELKENPYDSDLPKKIRSKERGYQCTFMLSIFWIGVICIFMVECAERIGCLLGIRSLFMGLTVLAAGTSIPDALGSIASASRGMGDMAVANAIGSNVFDILIGLGLPWFLRGVIFKEAYMVIVDDLIIFIGILFSTIIITLLAFLITRWKLGPTLGKILLTAYILFIFFAFIYVYLWD